VFLNISANILIVDLQARKPMMFCLLIALIIKLFLFFPLKYI